MQLEFTKCQPLRHFPGHVITTIQFPCQHKAEDVLMIAVSKRHLPGCGQTPKWGLTKFRIETVIFLSLHPVNSKSDILKSIVGALIQPQPEISWYVPAFSHPYLEIGSNSIELCKAGP